MGSQQLLLLVLAVIVVGVATVAGIVAFNEQGAKSRDSAAREEALRIVTSIQSWKMKPGALGGGSSRPINDFSGMTFAALGYRTPDSEESYISVNGCYVVTGAATGAVLDVFLGHLEEDCDPSTKIATVKVSGVGTQDIAWETD